MNGTATVELWSCVIVINYLNLGTCPDVNIFFIVAGLIWVKYEKNDIEEPFISTTMWVPATVVWSSSISSISTIMLLRSMQSRIVNLLLSKQPGRNKSTLGPDGEHGFGRIKLTLKMINIFNTIYLRYTGRTIIS